MCPPSNKCNFLYSFKFRFPNFKLLQPQNVVSSVSSHFILSQQAPTPPLYPLRAEEFHPSSVQFRHSSSVQISNIESPPKQIPTLTKKSVPKPKPNNRRNVPAVSQPAPALPVQTKTKSESGETNLDQIANMLFTNSNLATVQFDPQQAMEFGQILEQTKMLKEVE